MELYYPDYFRKDLSDYAYQRIKYGDSFVIVGLPGVGKTTALKILVKRLKTYDNLPPIVYCDLNDLSPVTEEAALNYLLEKASIELKRETNTFEEFNAVFIVDRFEKAAQSLPATFFDKLRYIRSKAEYKTVFILSSDNELPAIRDTEDIHQFYTAIAALTYYLKPFNEKEAKYYINEYTTKRDLKYTQEQKDKLYEVAGGHARLINAYVLAMSIKKINDFDEALREANDSEAVTYQCQRIYNHLTGAEKRALQRLTAKLDLSLADKEALNHTIKLGIIDDDYKFFGKSFETFIRKTHPAGKKPLYLDEITGEIFKQGARIDQNLSAQEYKFFRYLMENPDRIIPRDELVEVAWGAKQEEGVSDEAIDQLVSRLREKVEDTPSEPKHITTIRGRGFQLKLG